MDQPGKVTNMHVVSCTGKMNISLSLFAPENLVSRDGFVSAVSRQLAYSILGLNMVLTYGVRIYLLNADGLLG